VVHLVQQSAPARLKSFAGTSGSSVAYAQINANRNDVVLIVNQSELAGCQPFGRFRDRLVGISTKQAFHRTAALQQSMVVQNLRQARIEYVPIAPHVKCGDDIGGLVLPTDLMFRPGRQKIPPRDFGTAPAIRAKAESDHETG
jgi:hypothetical protein